MAADLIKYYFIFYYSLYISLKLLKTAPTNKSKLVFSLSSALLSLLCYNIEPYLFEAKYILPLLSLWIIISFISAKPQIAFISSTISFCISFCIYALASFAIDCILFAILDDFPSYILLAFSSGFLEAILVKIYFSTKRFNGKTSFIFSVKAINFATILSLTFISLTFFFEYKSFFYIGFASFIFTLAFLIYWWQVQITKSYRRSLEQREMESLRTELQEKNMTMIKVIEESERVHHINHRDNSLLTTLDYAVMSILEMDFSDEAAVKDRCKELATEIHRARDRRVTTVHTDVVPSTRYKTNITLLDLLLNNTSKRALDEHVLFSVHVRADLSSFIPGAITDDDLVYLLSDLLENAFVATRDNGSRMIQLQFYRWNKHLVVEIADNGIPFEVDSILQMGIERRTTHGDTGGTGVGLMDIWEIKEKYGATYHLDEYESATPFTKKISLTFDKKNRYSVRTWRKNDILSRSKRIDLQVYGQNED